MSREQSFKANPPELACTESRRHTGMGNSRTVSTGGSAGSATAVEMQTIMANPRMFCAEWPSVLRPVAAAGTAWHTGFIVNSSARLSFASCRVCGRAPVFQSPNLKPDAARERVHVTLLRSLRLIIFYTREDGWLESCERLSVIVQSKENVTVIVFVL